jgi:hypothetical protein
VGDASTSTIGRRLERLWSRQSRRGWWAYILWLLVYYVYAFGFASEATFHSGASLAQLWPLLLPVALVGFQWYRPTLLGWAILLALPAAYIARGIYHVVILVSDGYPVESLTLAFAYDALVIGVIVCVAMRLGPPGCKPPNKRFNLTRSTARIMETDRRAG